MGMTIYVCIYICVGECIVCYWFVYMGACVILFDAIAIWLKSMFVHIGWLLQEGPVRRFEWGCISALAFAMPKGPALYDTIEALEGEGFTFVHEAKGWELVDGMVCFTKRWAWCPDESCKRGCGFAKPGDKANCVASGYVDEEFLKSAVLNHVLKSSAPCHNGDGRKSIADATEWVEENWEEICKAEVEDYSAEEVEAWHLSSQQQKEQQKEQKVQQRKRPAPPEPALPPFAKVRASHPRVGQQILPQADSGPASGLQLQLAGASGLSRFGTRTEAAAATAMATADFNAKTNLLRQA